MNEAIRDTLAAKRVAYNMTQAINTVVDGWTPGVPDADDDTAEQRLFESDVNEVYADLFDVLVSDRIEHGYGDLSSTPGGAMNGLLARLDDTTELALSMHFNPVVRDEPALERVFLDLANYAVLAVMALRGHLPAGDGS